MSDSFIDRLQSDREEITFNYVQAVEKEIKKEEPNVFRIVERDYEKYMRCWALSDITETGQRRTIPVITENTHEGRSLFGRMLGDPKNFYAGGIMETVKVGNRGVPKYQSVDPELIDLLFTKFDPSGRSGSWKPRAEYMFNIIDRDYEIENGQKINWCAHNKHTKLLKLTPIGFDAFVSLIENEGPDVENYDINYSIKVISNRYVHTLHRAGPMIPNVVTGPLTPEELAYAKYNLKQIVRVSSATFCLKWFRQTIERISRA